VPNIQRLPLDDTRAQQAWDAFVMAAPGATFFHRAGWQRVLRQAFRHDTHFLYAEEGGSVTGVLPLAHVRSLLFGNTLTSLPFAVYGGVVATTPAAAAALEGAAERLARDLRVDHLEMRNLERRHPDWPEQDLYVTFRKELAPDADANMQAIPRKQRAMVRKGIKNGLTSHVDAGFDRLFALYADNVHRHGTPAMPRRYFEALRREFGKDCEILTVCSIEGTPVSSVLSFYFRDEVLPYYAGDAEAARDLAANDFKYWELMRMSCARGIKVFDYGRSKRGTGSFSFKKNWGFEPQQLHYEYRLLKRESVPQNNPSNTKYKLLIETWRRLPIGVANWLGPFVVRGLG
jgi:FemAB-related protein (PEP-CTERM system-associated)